jgi:Zn-dependent peptidase ImmA (M78 family)
MTKAEREAQQVLAEVGVSTPPIPVERIAQALAATLSFEPFEGNVSAMLYRDAHRTVIGVNARHSRGRRRFSIAHELGHLRLHPGRPVILDQIVRVNFRDERSSLATDLEEIAANAFAAELLMPAALVAREVDRHLGLVRASDARLLKTLAEAFDVSKAAMGIRLVNLGLQSTPAE